MRIPSMGKEWFKTRSLHYGSYKESFFPTVSVGECRKSRIKV